MLATFFVQDHLYIFDNSKVGSYVAASALLGIVTQMS
jgi:hypothetical protein